MCVVTLFGLVLDVCDVDRDATLTLFRSLVDVGEINELVARHPVVQDLGDRSGQCGLAVVDVTHGAHIEVRLGALERLL